MGLFDPGAANLNARTPKEFRDNMWIDEQGTPMNQKLMPDTGLFESICPENEKSVRHMVGK